MAAGEDGDEGAGMKRGRFEETEGEMESGVVELVVPKQVYGGITHE